MGGTVHIAALVANQKIAPHATGMAHSTRTAVLTVVRVTAALATGRTVVRCEAAMCMAAENMSAATPNDCMTEEESDSKASQKQHSHSTSKR
jgi:hypothetical protein